jgi:uncharacterized protein (DUF433 family)
MKRIILSSIIGGALALASIGGVVQAAQSTQVVSATQVLGTQAANGGGQHRVGKQELAGGLIKATADATGLTNAQIVEQLKAGKSLAQIAQDKGKSADTIIAAVRTQLKQRLDKTVTNKKLTQAKADALLANFDTNAPTVMQDAKLGQTIQQRQDQRQKGAAASLLIKATSDVTGLTPKEITTELKAGKSLAQIAQSKGKTADDILAKAKELVAARQQVLLNNASTLINQAGLTK